MSTQYQACTWDIARDVVGAITEMSNIDQDIELEEAHI